MTYELIGGKNQVKHSEKTWRDLILPVNATVADAINNLNQFAIKIVLVVNNAGVLEGTISDGDIRRALLKGLNLKSPITQALHRNPLVVPPELSRELVMQLMASNKIQQIPIVNEHHNIVGIHLWDTISASPLRSNIMVIMAGGLGTRLRPYTETCPKPLLLVGGKPMLQHIIERAKLEGFTNFVIAINYLGHMIEAHMGDGKDFDVKIEYLHEDSPLGTAGALSLLKPLPDSPFVVINGDVICDIRYSELIDFHIRHDAIGTMAVRLQEWQNPFGVVKVKDLQIIGFEEKPVSRHYINAGIYVLDPSALSLLSPGERCDMPTLFKRIQDKFNMTIAYPMHEPWLDVGQPDDLELANNPD